MRRATPSTDRVRAVFNGVVVAESDRTLRLEGRRYFPREDVRLELLHPSAKQTWCPWKGTASYYDVDAGSARSAAGAWYYAEPKPAAAAIRDHVAFWRDVRVEEP